MSHPGSPGEVHREPLVVPDCTDPDCRHAGCGVGRAWRRSLLLTRELPTMMRHHIEQGAMSNA